MLQDTVKWNDRLLGSQEKDFNQKYSFYSLLVETTQLDGFLFQG